MAQELGAGAGRRRRDPRRLLLYREALGLTPGEVRSLRSAQWSEQDLPSSSLADRRGILRTLAGVARAQQDGWAEERRRLERLAEYYEISAEECASILTESSARAPQAQVAFPAPVEPVMELRRRTRWSRRSMLLAGTAAIGGLATIVFARRFLERRAQRARFEGFEQRFGDALLIIELECDFLLGTGRVPFRSRGVGFFVSPDGLLVTNKHVIQPWKFVPELVRKLDSGYTLDEDSVRLRAWRRADLVLAGGGRLVEADSVDTRAGSLELVRTTPDQRELRVVALPEGGVHRGEYHLLDRSNVALLRARVSEPVPAIELTPRSAVHSGDPVLALGLAAPNRVMAEGGGRPEGSSGRVYLRSDGVLKLTASVPAEFSGGPVFDADGRAVGIAAQHLGDPRGARCVPVQAAIDLMRA
ncbi:MAG: S1-C subfamily serine protease [Chlamydiales bacterium]|jgi:S1-C subfamily serine protease